MALTLNFKMKYLDLKPIKKFKIEQTQLISLEFNRKIRAKQIRIEPLNLSIQKNPYPTLNYPHLHH